MLCSSGVGGEDDEDADNDVVDVNVLADDQHCRWLVALCLLTSCDCAVLTLALTCFSPSVKVKTIKIKKSHAFSSLPVHQHKC